VLFTGFKKSLYAEIKFQSDTERRFSVILENDPEVQKWFKPAKGLFCIYYADDDEYVPDFAVETAKARYICEPKADKDMDEDSVQKKAKAAVAWCRHASAQGGKPWRYLLIPHDKVDDSKTLAGLAAAWEFAAP
jgi:type III restriction enzyme